MTKNKKILLFLLLFIPFFNVKAVAMDYDFSGYNKATRVDFGLYNNTTLVQDALVACTSSNDGFCAFSNYDNLTGEVTFNNLRFVIRGTDGVSFRSGGQYRISFFFLAQTSDYYITQNTLTNTTGNTYQNFSSWTSNEIGIVSSTIVPIETQPVGGETATLYRVDIVFSVTTSTISGFNFRLYRQAKTIYESTPCDIELFRYYSVKEVTPGSIDYTNSFNNVIDNQNQNTQDIIDNNNQNTQAIIDSNKSCTSYDKTSIVSDNYRLNGDGSLISGNNFGTSDYIPINSDATFSVINNVSVSANYTRYCFYTNTKTYISCNTVDNVTINTNLTIPQNASYIRFAINKNENRPIYKICKNGSQAITDSITNDNVDGASSDASNFFSSFTTQDNGGLSAIITAPLVVVNGMLSGGTCSDLSFQVMGTDVTFPSGCILWQNAPQNIVTIYQLILCGSICYILLRKLFKDIEDLKDPNKEGVSTLDL